MVTKKTEYILTFKLICIYIYIYIYSVITEYSLKIQYIWNINLE